jgi:hypothetical protein
MYFLIASNCRKGGERFKAAREREELPNQCGCVHAFGMFYGRFRTWHSMLPLGAKL